MYETTETPLLFPISEDDFDELPTMAFESSLVAPWTRTSSGYPIEIPISLGATLLCLRDLHELELKEGRSFIDDFSPSAPFNPPNLAEETGELVNWLLNEVTTYADCRQELLSKNARLLFESILLILQRLKVPLFPLSEKTCNLLRRLSLLEPVHPYCMHIIHVLFEKATGFCADSESLQQNIASNLEDYSTDITQFIQRTYCCNNISRQDRLRLTNLFNMRIFQDLYMVTENKTRNIIRVIIRNLIFIIQRYIITMCADMKTKRQETWLLNTINMRPHICEYAIVAIARRVGPLMFRFARTICMQNELAVRAMINIFCSNTDNMWLPGQTLSSIKVETDFAICHSGCVCHHDE
ncbi:hypothetical protein ECG_07435 [Echinococcus granulosus]|uniref:Expressed conserved protein n=1 Tax=Echinococcus granulosus TaxID=6210 RepID=A0A068WQQ6_ECHGR|nr:hypothetical protein ECG_07435 [Echinococcus granulosus]CDS22137.1 expressed conserved protein [Echinococcus granulosus]